MTYEYMHTSYLLSYIPVQIVVRARDLGTPAKVSEDQATVTVQVQRNVNCPQFDNLPYSADVDETLSVNGEVLRAVAVDRDSQVSTRRPIM